MIEGMHELKLNHLRNSKIIIVLIAMHDHIYIHVGASQKVHPKVSSQNYYL